MLVKVVRECAIGEAVPSKIYIDGEFVCYGLENDSYKIPVGSYSCYCMESPKFGTNKVYLNVPGRSGIMFHGGNSSYQTKGCILTGKNRDGDEISGDCSDEFFNKVYDAYKRGEGVTVLVLESCGLMPLLIAAGAALLFVTLLKR